MKKTIIVAALIVSVTAAILYGLWASRPVAEVYVAQRGTAISAVYGTVKVLASLSMNVGRAAAAPFIFPSSCRRTPFVGLDVKQGDLLATIVNEDLDREIAKAESDLKAAVERQKLGPPSQPQLNTQEALLARMEKLAQMQNVSASDLERTRNDVQTLRERVRAEQVELDRVVTIQREQAGVLQDRKAHCSITSPIDGYLSAINCVNGEFISDGSTPFVVATRSMYLEGQINEEDVGQSRRK